MVINIDVFFVENLIVNFFLLYITSQTVKIRVHIGKLILGASIGSIYGIAALVPTLGFLNFLPIKMFIAVIMLLAAFQKKDLLFIIKSCAIFILYSMLLAGVCIFIQFSEQGYLPSNSVIINFTYKKLLLAIMAIYIVIDRLVIFIKDRLQVNKLIYKVDIIMGSTVKTINAFLDTGNELREPVSNAPVILVEKNLFNVLSVNQKDKYLIPYSVVNGYSGKLEGFKPDYIRIHLDKRSIETDRAVVALCDNKLSNLGEYNGLLSRGILQYMEGNYD